jgi:hypothetical protein
VGALVLDGDRPVQVIVDADLLAAQSDGHVVRLQEVDDAVELRETGAADAADAAGDAPASV